MHARTRQKNTDIVDEYVQRILASRDEFRGIVQILPLGNAALQESIERLFAPRRFARIADGRKCGRGSVLLRLGAEVEREGAVAAHGVAKYRLAGKVLVCGPCPSRVTSTRSEGGGRTMGMPAASMTWGSSRVTCVSML